MRMTQLRRLFGLAYGRAASVSCAVNGFQKCGIFPVNMLVFDDADFAGAEVTDQLNSSENVSPVGVATATSWSVDTSTNLSSSLNPPSTFTIDTLTNLPLRTNSGSSVTSDTFAKVPAETPTLLHEINQSHENIACSSTNTGQVGNTSFGNQFSKIRVTVQDISPLPKKMSSGNAGGRR